MKAVVTVIGKDKVGIIYNVSAVLAKFNVNILDINQTIMQDYFTMVMMTEISGCTISFEELKKELEKKGNEIQMSIRIQHEGIFNAMNEI